MIQSLSQTIMFSVHTARIVVEYIVSSTHNIVVYVYRPVIGAAMMFNRVAVHNNNYGVWYMQKAVAARAHDRTATIAKSPRCKLECKLIVVATHTCALRARTHRDT